MCLTSINFSQNLVDGATIYHLAVENNDLYVIQSATLNDLLRQDRDEETVLHYAATNGNSQICEYLIKNFPSLINILDNDGRDALSWAREFNHSNIVLLLNT